MSVLEVWRRFVPLAEAFQAERVALQRSAPTDANVLALAALSPFEDELAAAILAIPSRGAEHIGHVDCEGCAALLVEINDIAQATVRVTMQLRAHRARLQKVSG